MTTAETTAEDILSQALETVNLTPRYRNVRYMKFGEDIIYFVGEKKLLQTTCIAVLQDRPSLPAQELLKLCLEQMRERKATLIVGGGDISLAASYTKAGGNVVLLLACGIRNVKLGMIMPAIESGNALVLSLSERDPSDSESIVTANRLLAALCYCGFVVECQGGAWNSKTNQWGNHIMQKCEMIHSYGKTIFIAPWRKGHPAQHLVIKHEFNAVDLPEAEDAANVFSFIPEALEDIE